MTIVVWDGKTLAADRMTTLGHAGSIESHRTSESTKIILFPNKPRFGDIKDRRLLAAAYSGTVSVFSAFHDFVFEGVNDPANADVDYHERVRIVVKMQVGTPRMSAMYLVGDNKGETHVDLVTWLDNFNSPLKQGRFLKARGVVAIGSGKTSSRVFTTGMKDLNSIQLVHLATRYADGCGHGIDYFQAGWTKTKRIKELTARDKAAIAKLFADSL